MKGKFMSRKQQLRHKKRHVHRPYSFNIVVGNVELICMTNSKEINIVESEYQTIDGKLTYSFLSEDDAT